MLFAELLNPPDDLPTPPVAQICLKPVLTKGGMFPGACSPVFLLIPLPYGGVQTPIRPVAHFRSNPSVPSAVTKLASLVTTSSILLSGVFRLCVLEWGWGGCSLGSNILLRPPPAWLPTFGGCCSQAQPTFLCLGQEATFLAPGGW